MNSRERFIKTIKHETPDRIPLDGWFSVPVWEELKEFKNIKDDEELRNELGIDFRMVLMEPSPDFSSKPFFLKNVGVGVGESDYFVREAGNLVYENEWGIKMRVSKDSDNWSYAYHPLEKKFSLSNLIIPDLNIPERFIKVKEDIKKYKDNFVIFAGVSTLFRKGWLLCGFSNFLEMLLTDLASIEKLLDILMDFTINEIKLYVNNGVDLIELLGDLGTELSLFLSPDLWRRIFKPRLKNIIDAFKKENVYFFLHSDGNIKDIIPDLIEAGLDILNPIQPECMNPADIKKDFGDKIVLHGTMSMQKTFLSANPGDVVEETRSRIEKCGNKGGLILAPSNVFTPDIPIVNIDAFYNFVKNYKTNK